jgi:hypothetical protein
MAKKSGLKKGRSRPIKDNNEKYSRGSKILK